MRPLRVYACFDATGSKNPAATDLKYYFLLRAWSRRAPPAGSFVDVHDVAPVRRSAPDLRHELATRMRSSDVLLIILSARTPFSTGLLAWELELASDGCSLPIVCAYTSRDSKAYAIDDRWWPAALRRMLVRPHVRALHVPFRRTALERGFGSLRATIDTDLGAEPATAASAHGCSRAPWSSR